MPTELAVTERAAGMDPTRISAELMGCLKRAQAGLTGQVRELVLDSGQGEQDTAARSIIAGYEARLPERKAAPEPAPAVARRHEIQFDIDD